MSSQNNENIPPDDINLDWAQILYAFNYKHIIFLNNYKIWLNFYDETGFKYIDYTPEELSQRFLQHILPNIYEYELTEDELHLLNILDLHPKFIKTSSGFELKETESLIFPSNESVTETFMTQGDFVCETEFFGENVNSNHQIVIKDYNEQRFNYQKFNFDSENAALLSVTLCSDEGLPNCEILNLEEFYNRLKAAKRQFENSGQQLDNINIPLSSLLKKLVTIKKLMSAVIELVQKFSKNT